jgi:hypothetical protein
MRLPPRWEDLLCLQLSHGNTTWRPGGKHACAGASSGRCILRQEERCTGEENGGSESPKTPWSVVGAQVVATGGSLRLAICARSMQHNKRKEGTQGGGA